MTIFLLLIKDLTVDVLSVSYPLRFQPTLLKVCLKIKAYNSSLVGFDGADMQLSFYSNTRKSLKVWKKWPSTCFNAFLINAYVLYKSNTSGKVISRFQFCQEVIDGLAMRYLNELPPRRFSFPLCKKPAKTKLIKLAGTKSIVQ